MSAPTVAVVIAGGDLLDPDVVEELPAHAYVVAADSGLEQAQRLGIRVHRVVGDLDSATPEALARLSPDVLVDRHPWDKDATDLELALAVVAALDVDRVLVLGGHGGRLDHLLANAALLASPRFSHLDVEWVAGSARVTVVRRTARLHGTPGELITLVPIGGPALGVTTTGLRWPLSGEDLAFGTTRGVSNQFRAPLATVTLSQGCLLAVQPEATPPSLVSPEGSPSPPEGRDR